MTRKLSVQLLGVGVALAAIAVALVLVARSGPSDDATTRQPGPVLRADSYDEGEVVEPDPDFGDGLALARFSTSDWKTDFSRHTVPFDQIIGGGPERDGIPPLDFPRFTTTQDAGIWLGGEEPVIALELNGDARAYPLQILLWHEIVNDDVGGVPVAVTFCPLCNSAIVFDRRLGSVVYDFGNSGTLRYSDLIMWDRQTESWWQQFTGEAIIGSLAGKRLRFVPASIVSFSDFEAAYPGAKVLSRGTGFNKDYRRNPYPGYDRADLPPSLFAGSPDDRLQPKERVVGVTVNGVDVAFPFAILRSEKAVNYTVGGQDVVVLFKPGTRSALDQSSIQTSKDVGATGVFVPVVDGRKLTFRADGESLVDNETGSVWSILGRAVEGPLAGERLTPIIHGDHLWFAWGAFKPDTLIYSGTG